MTIGKYQKYRMTISTSRYFFCAQAQTDSRGGPIWVFHLPLAYNLHGWGHGISGLKPTHDLQKAFAAATTKEPRTSRWGSASTASTSPPGTRGTSPGNRDSSPSSRNRLSFPDLRIRISGIGRTSFIRPRTERIAAPTPPWPSTTSRRS